MREKKYRTRVPVTINLEDQILRDFKELCYKERVSMSEKVNLFMEQELKKEVGPNAPNAIGVAYQRNTYKGYGNSSANYTEPLDKYLSENFVTSKDWFSFYQRIDDIAQVERHEALAVTISKQARQRMHFLKTGKCLVQ